MLPNTALLAELHLRKAPKKEMHEEANFSNFYLTEIVKVYLFKKCEQSEWPHILVTLYKRSLQLTVIISQLETVRLMFTRFHRFHCLSFVYYNNNKHWQVIIRVTTCLENLEMSGNLTAVMKMSWILLNVREMSGKKSCQGKVA